MRTSSSSYAFIKGRNLAWKDVTKNASLTKTERDARYGHGPKIMERMRECLVCGLLHVSSRRTPLCSKECREKYASLKVDQRAILAAWQQREQAEEAVRADKCRLQREAEEAKKTRTCLGCGRAYKGHNYAGHCSLTCFEAARARRGYNP